MWSRDQWVGVYIGSGYILSVPFHNVRGIFNSDHLFVKLALFSGTVGSALLVCPQLRLRNSNLRGFIRVRHGMLYATCQVHGKLLYL